MTTTETKNYTLGAGLELKADASKREVTAYASVFGNLDSYGDRVMPGAYTKTLAEGARRVRVLRDHDPRQIVGTPLVMEQDSRGLLTVSKIAKTAAGDEMLALLSDGAINELSVGFSTVKSVDNGLGGRDLLELRLYEYSYVVWAANDLATVESIKSQSDLFARMAELQNVITAELKAGKVLSEESARRVIAARDALNELLDAAGIKAAATPGTPSTTASDNAAEPPQALDLLDTIRSLGGGLTREREALQLVDDLRSFGYSLTRP